MKQTHICPILKFQGYKLIHDSKAYNTKSYKGIYLTKEAKELIKNYSKEYCKIFNYKCEI